MARKLALPKIHEIAAKLAGVEGEILAFTEPLAQLKIRKEELREEMLEALRAHRLDSLKTDGGVLFKRAFRASLEITDPVQALDWAVREGCAKVDTTAANKALKGAGALPEGFGYKETEYLSVGGLKDSLTE